MLFVWLLCGWRFGCFSIQPSNVYHIRVYVTALLFSLQTFTMSSIYSQASSDIFTLISSIRSPTPPTVTISMVEVAGDSIHDLLNTYASTNTRMASDGGVHIYPVVECVVENMENMMGVIQHGVNVRSTAATGM